MAPRQADITPGPTPTFECIPPSPDLNAEQYLPLRKSSIQPSGWNIEVTREDTRAKPSLSASSVHSSKSHSTAEDSYGIFTNFDAGHSAAFKKHSPDLDKEDLSVDILLARIGSFSEPESLDSLLRDSLVTSHCGGSENGTARKWLPVDRLFQHVTESQVLHELLHAFGPKLRSGGLSRTQLGTWAQKICRKQEYKTSGGEEGLVSCQKIFAILTLMERVQDAPAFLDAGITDVHLPLGHETGKKSKLYSYSDHTKEVSVALQWQAKHFDLFDQYQSYMLSPFFELKKGEVPYYELHAESVLPFIENKSTERRLLGLHGTVYRVKIHPAHHDLHEGLDKTEDRGRNPPFAVKELTEKGMEEEVGFQKEVEAWRRCAGIHGHDHLIKILAVWRQKNAWNLLQPWADGNLWDYWEERNSANRDLGLTTWILDQLLGLAEALRQIHRRRTGDLEVRLWGIHGDIKPHNILWFKESTPESNPMGRLVICDFGFTSFHTKASISKVQPEGHSPTYQAPEYGAESGISQAYDFWSLGCVYLEFITWYLLGYEDVKYTFANQRTDDDKAKFFPGDKFFNQDEEGKAFVKDSVYKWIWHLRSLAHCSELFHDLLDLVEKKLLVANAQERQLNCQDLVRRLSKLQRDCKARGVAYAVGGACYMPQLNHPVSTEDASMWAGRPASSPLGPPRLTYLSVTSDESREVEARDLVGIDPRISTRPPQQDLIRASNHSSRLSRDITHEETPLLEQQRTSCRESGRPQKKHQASQSPGQFLQGTQVDEIAIDSGRNNSDKINQVDKDTGLTALMKNWLKGLFQCSKYRHKKGHT